MDPSNRTLNDAELSAAFRESITPEIHGYISFSFKVIVTPAFALASLLLNTINMMIFYKMGLSDGVAQNFFILALCDCLSATASFVNCMAYILRTIIRSFIGYGGVEQVVQLVYQASFYSMPFPQNYSITVTVVIAVVRCCCVAIPLKVKHLITVRRQLAAILFLSGIATSILVYVVAPLNIFYVPNRLKNTTEAYFRGARWPTYIVFNNISGYGSFIICIACVIILSTSLSKASKFRGSSTTSTSTSTNNDNPSAPDPKAKERQRNARVVRTVVLISVIFIVCNVPTIVLYLMKTVVEGFGPGGKYQFTNSLTTMLAEAFMLLSGCLNTFIYLFCNSRYRDIFFTVLRRKQEVVKGMS